MNNTKSLSKLIGEMAVLASVQARAIGMTRLDRQASAESDERHNAMQGTMRGNLKRLPGCEEPVKAIKKVQAKGRTLLTVKTTQWRTDRRLLMNDRIGEFCGEFDMLVREHDNEVKTLIDMADDLIAKSRKNLGDYSIEPPTKQEISSAFALTYELAAVPDTDTYSAADKRLEAAMKARFEEDTKAAFHGAQRDLFERLAAPLENMVDRMKAYEERERLKDKGMDVGKEGTFKSSVVSNINEMAKLVRSMNITGDEAIEAIAKKLEVFEQLDHETLVKHADVRVEAAKRAADIRKSLGQWLD